MRAAPSMMPGILIVDDHKPTRNLLRLIINNLATNIYECDDGAGAVAAYALHQPDWVLMDVEMPKMDGLTATRHLTAQFPEAKVVIVAACSDKYLRQAAYEAGAHGYIIKENLLLLPSLLQLPPNV